MEEAPLPTLQPDALVHIFHKLPLRSVFQCKLVCKEWCSLISDSSFKSTYNPSTVPSQPLCLLMIPSLTAFHPSCEKVSALRYEIYGSTNPLICHPQPLPGDFNVEEDHIEVLGSGNGLVALYRHPGNFCLFNPCTGEEKLVHVPIDKQDWWMNYRYGLCHDYVSDEYKAVLITISYFDLPSFHVVSFKDGNWKLKTQSELKNLHFLRRNLGTIVNGVPHWICNVVSETSIVYFDQQKEDFEMIPVRNNAWSGKELWGLGALAGQLTAVVTSVVDGRIVGELEVWALKEYGDEDSWSKLFAVANEWHSLSPLAWIKDDEILLDTNEDELMIYNLRSQTLRQLQRKMERSSYSIITYFPSLVSPTQ